MGKRTDLWALMGFGVTSLGGTLLHFLYDWLGESWWVAPISGVNESTWEHMKLLFWPMLLFAILQSFFFRDRKDFWCVQLRSVLLGLGLIPVLFYTYNGVIGPSPDWLNISIFFVAAAVAYLYGARLLGREEIPQKAPKASLWALLLIGGLFVLFTFFPPQIGLFLDPVTGTYGV